MRRHPLVLPVVLSLPSLCSAGTPRIDWGLDPPAAFKRAEEERRPLLLLLSSSSCGGTAAIGVPGSGVFHTDCERLELDVLSQADVGEAAARYVPLMLSLQNRATVGPSATEADVARRYKLATPPTLLLADPWGNEIVRLVGYTPRDRVLRILKALPADFAPLRSAGEALRADPVSLPALVSAAAFYESSGLGVFAERCYDRAADTPAARGSVEARRGLAVARGLNLLRLGQAKRAAEIFKAEVDAGATGPQADVVLFGWAMAELSQGNRDRAKAIADQLGRDFPASPYTERLRQNLGPLRPSP
jgi:hypothetical protein